MINLAGVAKCDETIRNELRRARIEAVDGERMKSEVPYSVTGSLPGFTFTRAWRYWMVSGHVPLDVAKELYADPIGRTDVRVAGNYGCQAPEPPWVTYVGDGFVKLLRLDSPDAPSNRQRDPSEFMARIYAQVDDEYRFVEDPAAVAKYAYVDSYHIDTMEGLRLFADTVRSL